MRPLSLAERMLAPTTVSMTDLLGGGRPPLAGTCEVRLSDYVEEILASGFPAIRSTTPRARRALLAGYVTAVVQADFPQQGLRVRRPATLAAWMTAYAAATATTASYNSILDAATSGEGDKPAKTTTIVYRDVLSALWLLDPVPGWLPGRNHINKLTQAPKHHLADPALAAELLGLDGAALMVGAQPGRAVPRDGMLLGHLFESLVTQSVRVYAQAREATVHHLRTQNGLHEVDLVVQRRDHKVVAFEVKLGHEPDAVLDPAPSLVAGAAGGRPARCGRHHHRRVRLPPPRRHRRDPRRPARPLNAPGPAGPRTGPRLWRRYPGPSAGPFAPRRGPPCRSSCRSTADRPLPTLPA